MADQNVTRKLAAILCVDMVGYRRLVEKDEPGTIARQKAHRDKLIGPEVTEHHGRIVKTMGDGLLVSSKPSNVLLISTSDPPAERGVTHLWEETTGSGDTHVARKLQ